jgi:peptidyl-prolyl cis-trans isomerase SurA
MRTTLALALVLALGASSVACGGERAPDPSANGPAPAAEPTSTPPPPAPQTSLPPSDEVCAEVIVVQWRGAVGAPESIARSEEDARQRAEALLHRLESGGASFAELARAESDARASGARGGLLGTYAHDDWPPQHEAIRERAFALQVDETSEVLRAPYGWVILHRCAAEHRHTRHVLVRFQGARNAPEHVTRTRDEARALAAQIRARLVAPGADFEAIAREVSEDGSRERGGDMGWLGRGRLAPAYEEAAFALHAGQISEPVETEFGFHVIQRVE